MEAIVSQYEIIIRTIFALAMGLLIGLERQRRKTEANNHGAAGLRTHALVCVGTALITSLGMIIFPNDAARMAASIMTGIGFIGAGTIMASEKKEMGLTNAASVWATAAIGIACGVGILVTALFATIITLIVLQLRKFEKFE
jgi:putative Mg2+ transporter-C (MgtC) family protein